MKRLLIDTLTFKLSPSTLYLLFMRRAIAQCDDDFRLISGATERERWAEAWRRGWLLPNGWKVGARTGSQPSTRTGSHRKLFAATPEPTEEKDTGIGCSQGMSRADSRRCGCNGGRHPTQLLPEQEFSGSGPNILQPGFPTIDHEWHKQQAHSASMVAARGGVVALLASGS